MNELHGKIALVTGGTVGIGEAVVRRFTAEGAVVVFTGTIVKAAAAICEKTSAHFIPQDVSCEADWEPVVERLEELGGLDVAFANAGINTGDSNVETVTLEAWRKIFAVNVEGVLFTCRNAIRLMKSTGRKSGSIIINSSVVAMAGLPGDIAYTSSKGALRSMAKSVAVHCANSKLGIRCNSIHAGIVETPTIVKAINASSDPASAREFLARASPLGRMGTADEIADLVCYLGSDRSSFVTGAEWVIDGGAIAGFAGV